MFFVLVELHYEIKSTTVPPQATLVLLCLLKPNWSPVNNLSTVFSIRFISTCARFFNACVCSLGILYCFHDLALAFFNIRQLVKS